MKFSIIRKLCWPPSGRLLIIARRSDATASKFITFPTRKRQPPTPPPASTLRCPHHAGGIARAGQQWSAVVAIYLARRLEKKALSPMRVASFVILMVGKQADVSVIPLGGLAGNDPDNVNRWRGQVGLALLPEADISKLAEKSRGW